MLRASTLGLSLPSSNIFVVRSYRRLYWASKGWTLQVPPNASGSSSNSLLVPTNLSTAPRAPHLPSIPLDIYQQQQDQVGLSASEDVFVTHTQKLTGATEAHGGEASSPTAEHPPASTANVVGGKLSSSMMRRERGTTDARQPPEEELLAALGDSQEQPSSSGQEGQKDCSEVRFITERPAYAAGRPWAPVPVKPVEVPKQALHLLKNIERGIKVAKEKYWRQRKRHGRSADRLEAIAVENGLPSRDLPSLILKHLEVLGTTASVDQAWNSYVFLIDTIASHELIYSRLQYIPHSHLHRFSRLLAHHRPRTYLQYLRLLSVMTYIAHCGGELKLPQWNALIAHAAAGRRKTTNDDMEKAMAIFRGMRTGRLPGSSLFSLPEEYEERFDQTQPVLEPDVYTLTTLLGIAARVMDSATLKSVSHTMVKSGLAPSRITHLSLLRYFTYKRDLSGVRRTLHRMRHQGLEVGLDGLNTCIWAYGYNKRLDIVLLIYRVLRHNKIPETYLGPDDIHDAVLALKEESIIVEPGIIPNHITYTTVIQTLAYFGQFEPAIKVFIDMISMDNVEQGAPLYLSESGEWRPGPYAPSLPVYRAIFLGFAKHGTPARLNRHPDQPSWTMENLEEVFERFLDLPQDTPLNHSLLNIIMAAFHRTSDNDLDAVRKAWEALDRKFGIFFRKTHSESRLARLKRTLFPDIPSEPG
ncbi:hypothetical protein CVT26_000874 [Gymnopilus dilepis]|uniref:Pentatricopeptide repeat protein n=1 Tax=Gymnopilus dilepis TaxID=231916 RepID=A0A409YLG1_9AGAR|nr:hypothetical protein CVT26_000874 [Gymnopilus dilepis]